LSGEGRGNPTSPYAITLPDAAAPVRVPSTARTLRDALAGSVCSALENEVQLTGVGVSLPLVALYRRADVADTPAE